MLLVFILKAKNHIECITDLKTFAQPFILKPVSFILMPHYWRIATFHNLHRHQMLAEICITVCITLCATFIFVLLALAGKSSSKTNMYHWIYFHQCRVAEKVVKSECLHYYLDVQNLALPKYINLQVLVNFTKCVIWAEILIPLIFVGSTQCCHYKVDWNRQSPLFGSMVTKAVDSKFNRVRQLKLWQQHQTVAAES